MASQMASCYNCLRYWSHLRVAFWRERFGLDWPEASVTLYTVWCPSFPLRYLLNNSFACSSSVSKGVRHKLREISAILCESELLPGNKNGPGCSIWMLVSDRISLTTGYIAVTRQKALAIGCGQQLRPARLAENAFTR